jgi:hypothetical protein
VYEALEPSPLPALRRSEVEMRDLLSAATTALRGSGGRGGASEFSSGGFSSVAEPVGGGVSSQLGSSSTSQNPGSSDESHGTSRGSHASPRRHAHMTPAEVDRLHASQTEAMAFVLSGPTAADLSRAAAAARDAEAATAAEAARRELGVARARLDLARRRQAELDQSAFTCALAVGDDVFVITAPTTEEGSGGDAAAAAAAAAGPPAQLGTIINLEGVASYLVLLDDPNGNPTSKILARALLRAVRPKAEAAAAAELSAAQNPDLGGGDPFQFDYHDRLLYQLVELRRDPEDILADFAAGRLEEALRLPAGTTVVGHFFADAAAFVADLEGVWRRLKGSFFKRVQAPPIVAVSKRAFGFDLREAQTAARFTRRYAGLKAAILAAARAAEIRASPRP